MVLNDAQKNIIKKQFEKLTGDVELVVFTQEFECNFCKEARELLLEIGALSPKISTKVYDLVKDEEQAKKYNIKKYLLLSLLENPIMTSGIMACRQAMSYLL